MYDAASRSDATMLQRAVGELRVVLRVRDGHTVLDGLRQAGCLKARFPRPECHDWSTVVTLNTSGGIAGGDALASSFELQPGARATIASQAAERFYRALPGSVPASVNTHIAIAAGGAAEWLPQETILFDRCALDRRLEVELAEDASFLGIETLVFGRAAMGETVQHAWLRDGIRIRRDGRLVMNDAIRMDGEVARLLQRTAIARGAGAAATIWFVAREVEARLDAVRAILPDEAAASAWNGMLVTRLLADNAAALRLATTAVLHVLRDGRPLPRVWLC
jgi:urease accessory protein